MTTDRKKLWQVIQMEENSEGRIIYSTATTGGAVQLWTEAEGVEVAGDGVATGTTIVSLSIAATSKFACMHLMGSSNIAARLDIAYGTLASHTDVYQIDLQSAGSQVIITETTPIFVYDNTTAAAVTLLMIAPKTAYNLATNNDTNHYFGGFIGGLLFPYT